MGAGFLTAGESGDIPVFCALNSEEIGSRTTGGADSTILSDVLSGSAWRWAVPSSARWACS